MNREVLLHSTDIILPRNLQENAILFLMNYNRFVHLPKSTFLGLDMDIMTPSLWYITLLLFILKLCLLFGVFFENMFHPYLI